jgi:hypothetical protein
MEETRTLPTIFQNSDGEDIIIADIPIDTTIEELGQTAKELKASSVKFPHSTEIFFSDCRMDITYFFEMPENMHKLFSSQEALCLYLERELKVIAPSIANIFSEKSCAVYWDSASHKRESLEITYTIANETETERSYFKVNDSRYEQILKTTVIETAMQHLQISRLLAQLVTNPTKNN